MLLDTDLGASLISASLLNKPIYILGDMNCNLLQPELVDSQAFVNFCRTYNLNQALLDIILVSNAKHITEAKVLSSSISDHDLVYVNAEAEKAAKSIHVYDYQKFQKLFHREI